MLIVLTRSTRYSALRLTPVDGAARLLLVLNSAAIDAAGNIYPRSMANMELSEEEK